MELRSNRSRSRTPFVQTKLDEETVSTEQHNHSEEVMMQHTYSTRTRSYKSNNSSMSDEVFSSPMTQKSGRVTRRNRLKTSDYSSEDGEAEISSSKTDESSRSRVDTYTVRTNGEVKSALQVYKEAGEYWKSSKFPKTDYTYSVHSKDRVELAPGVIAMPNMSRRSLRSSTEHNLSNNNHTSHSQQRYNEAHTAASYNESHSAGETTLHHDFRPKALFRADSNESYMDETNIYSVVEHVSIVRRLYQSITTLLWSVLSRVLTILSVLYWTTTTAVLWIGRGYYRVVSRVLLFDTWLLQGTNGRKRYGTLAAILALPLLIFGGLHLTQMAGVSLVPACHPNCAELMSTYIDMGIDVLVHLYTGTLYSD